MENTIFTRGSLPALEALLHVTSARHRAIAQNIANADTAGYRTRDVATADFKQALRRAFDAQGRSPTGEFKLQGTATVRPTAAGLALRLVESPEAGALKHTGNDVDLEMEMGKLVKNALLHNLVAGLLSQQYAQLREAIAGRVLG